MSVDRARVVVLTAAMALAGSGAGCQQQLPREEIFTDTAHRVSSTERFAGETRVRTAGQDAPVRVAIRNWSLGGGLKLAELPLPVKGLMIVQLRGGRVTTVIQGNSQARREGEFWTVPPGVPMGVETGDDSATLQTIVVIQP